MWSLLRLILRMLLVFTGTISLVKCGSGYRKKSGKVFYNGKEVTDKNLVILNDVFAKNDSTAFYRGLMIEGADVAGFRALNEHYAKDTSRVYYCEQHRESQTYFTTKKQMITVIDGAEPMSFTLDQFGYARDRNFAYIGAKRFAVKDLSTFHAINATFSADRVHAYFNGVAVEGSDGRTFSVINNHYAKDSRHIYYYGYPSDARNDIYIVDCDIETFMVRDYPYATDIHRAYFEDEPIDGSQASGFTVIGNSFARDNQNVFYRTRKLPGASPSSFRLYQNDMATTIQSYFAGDKTGVYFEDKLIAAADVSTFRIIGLGYAADRNHVYYHHKIVPAADPASLVTYDHSFGDSDANDSGYYYLEGKRVKPFSHESQ